MKIPIYQIDAFTSEQFSGNPAAVCILDHWPEDQTLLNIAKENNLAETAFLVPVEPEHYHLRWFTPEIEMDLCGHATLASAYVVLNYLDPELRAVRFKSMSGELTVRRIEDQYELDFPSRPPLPCELNKTISEALSIQPSAWFKSRDYVLLFNSEKEILDLEVNELLLKKINIDPGGIIVTSKGDSADFVSRFFTPGAAIFEDPVTGSAHCSLAPFWAERLGKNTLNAQQLSARGGKINCEIKGDRVLLRGQAVPYLEGTITI
ncbi:MAG: PhzF family phenazine biosynthesis protein [Bacteroidia bacterium]|nr:PhzF family phenazine biosynthesis protein [Bacteroidia bacterium]NNK69042.1 PhzF family phenazine biosynthesis protein [Flavobacteriaceae bacterium]